MRTLEEGLELNPINSSNVKTNTLTEEMKEREFIQYFSFDSYVELIRRVDRMERGLQFEAIESPTKYQSEYTARKLSGAKVLEEQHKTSYFDSAMDPKAPLLVVDENAEIELNI